MCGALALVLAALVNSASAGCQCIKTGHVSCTGVFSILTMEASARRCAAKTINVTSSDDDVCYICSAANMYRFTVKTETKCDCIQSCCNLISSPTCCEGSTTTASTTQLITASTEPSTVKKTTSDSTTVATTTKITVKKTTITTTIRTTPTTTAKKSTTPITTTIRTTPTTTARKSTVPTTTVRRTTTVRATTKKRARRTTVRKTTVTPETTVRTTLKTTPTASTTTTTTVRTTTTPKTTASTTTKETTTLPETTTRLTTGQIAFSVPSSSSVRSSYPGIFSTTPQGSTPAIEPVTAKISVKLGPFEIKVISSVTVIVGLIAIGVVSFYVYQKCKSTKHVRLIETPVHRMSRLLLRSEGERDRGGIPSTPRPRDLSPEDPGNEIHTVAEVHANPDMTPDQGTRRSQRSNRGKARQKLDL